MIRSLAFGALALLGGCTLEAVPVLEPAPACDVALTRGERARAASDFTRALGVGVRLNYTDTPYRDLDTVRRRLIELGVSRVADTDTTDVERLAALGASGFDLEVLGTVGAPESFLASLGAPYVAFTAALDSSGDLVALGERFGAARAALDRTPGGARVALGLSAPAPELVPELAGVPVDYLSLELFPRGEAPEPGLDAVLGSAPAGPPLRLQLGYSTTATNGGVSSEVQTRYLLRALFGATRRGFTHLTVGQLCDWSAVADYGGALGLLDANLTPKPAFMALARWQAALAAVRAAPVTHALDFTLTSPEPFEHLLLERPDGAFLLLLWLAVPSVPSERTALVELTLRTPIASAIWSRPDRDSLPLERFTHPRTLALELSDAPGLLELVPACIAE